MRACQVHWELKREDCERRGKHEHKEEHKECLFINPLLLSSSELAYSETNTV